MTKKPRILITNDDGVHASGIRHLWNSLKNIADVTVIAPSEEQSAVGLSITTRRPLHIEQLNWEGCDQIYSVTGTPADCIKLGISVFLKDPPDLVVSGVNRGSNAGRNLLYSGTVAGVIEATMQDLPGVAFSLDNYESPQYQHTEPHIPKIVDYVLKNPLPKGTLLNVNFPETIAQGIKGFKLTRQGKQFWKEKPDKREHPVEKGTYYWLGATIAKYQEEEDSDIFWLKQGYLTAVPVYVEELTHHKQLSSRKSEFEELFTV